MSLLNKIKGVKALSKGSSLPKGIALKEDNPEKGTVVLDTLSGKSKLSMIRQTLINIDADITFPSLTTLLLYASQISSSGCREHSPHPVQVWSPVTSPTPKSSLRRESKESTLWLSTTPSPHKLGKKSWVLNPLLCTFWLMTLVMWVLAMTFAQDHAYDSFLYSVHRSCWSELWC